jgi:hypothetical protein
MKFSSRICLEGVKSYHENQIGTNVTQKNKTRDMALGTYQENRTELISITWYIP